METKEHVIVKVLNNSGNDLPEYATKDSAGFDLSSFDNMLVPARSSRLVGTGLFLSIPEGYELQIRPRSGLAFKHMVTVLNTPGTIDADYRGEIGVILINHSNKAFEVKKGDRIAQAVLNKVERVQFHKVDRVEELGITERGVGGFGSTDKK